MKRIFALLLVLALIAGPLTVRASRLDSFWFDEEEVEEGGGKLEKRNAVSQEDTLEQLTREDVESLQLKNPLDTKQVDPSLASERTGPMTHVMIKAFDEDGDGLLDRKELGKIDKDAWFKFHRSMTHKVFNALENVAPDVKRMKEHVTAHYKKRKAGENIPLGEELNKDMLNPDRLQNTFQKGIREAHDRVDHWSSDAVDSTKPHLQLKAKAIEHAKKLMSARK